MKNTLLYIILCILVIIILYDYFLSKEREDFTPGIRSFYRPCERTMREGYAKLRNKLGHRSNMFFRKIGII